MPGIVNLIAAISTDVNSKLVAQGLPALVDGQIVIGRVRIDENPAAPRVIFVPKGAKFEARSTPNRSNVQGSVNNPGQGLRSVLMTQLGGGYTTASVSFSAPDLAGGTAPTAVAVVNNGAIKAVALTSSGSGYSNPPTVTISGDGTGATALANLLPTLEKLSQWSQRSIFTEVTQFEVHCWGVTASGSDPNVDFDSAQLLYQQVIQSSHLLAPGAAYPVNGQWFDQRPDGTQIDLLGHYFVFNLEFRTPVLDVGLQQAPVGVTTVQTSSIISPTGSVEQGFQG